MKKSYLVAAGVAALVEALLVGCGSGAVNVNMSGDNTGSENVRLESSQVEGSQAGNLAMEVSDVMRSSCKVIFTNKTGRELTYGDDFVLEMAGDIAGEWTSVPYAIDNWGFDAIGHMLADGATAEQDINWEWLYGVLSPGKYRIVKTVLDVKEPGDYEEYTLSCEFEIP